MEAEKPLLVAGNVTSPDHHVPGGPELQGGGRLLVGGSGGQGRVSRQGLEQSDQLGILVQESYLLLLHLLKVTDLLDNQSPGSLLNLEELVPGTDLVSRHVGILVDSREPEHLRAHWLFLVDANRNQRRLFGPGKVIDVDDGDHEDPGAVLGRLGAGVRHPYVEAHYGDTVPVQGLIESHNTSLGINGKKTGKPLLKVEIEP